MKWIKTNKAIDNMGSRHWRSTTSNDPISVGIAYTMIAKGEFVEYLDEYPAQPNGDEVLDGSWQEMLRHYRDNDLFDDKYETKNLAFVYAFQMGFRSRQPEVDALKKRVEELEGELGLHSRTITRLERQNRELQQVCDEMRISRNEKINIDRLREKMGRLKLGGIELRWFAWPFVDLIIDTIKKYH